MPVGRSRGQHEARIFHFWPAQFSGKGHSDIDGPMGRELIPFSKEKKAKAFMKDHKGKAIVTFNKVTAAMLKEIDQMK